MSQKNDQIINDFLANFPRQKIIETLNEIESKISSLHTISSKDFLYFNKLLKKYYSKIKEISTANNVISVYFNTDLPVIKDEIKEKNTVQIQLLQETDSIIYKIIEFLTKTYSSFDQLIVPFSNFKQNLITLKYILANLKLHLNYIDLINKDQLQRSIKVIENSVEEIHSQLELINKKTESVSLKILELKNNSCIGQNIDNTKLKEGLKKVSNSLKKRTFEEYSPENLVLNLNNHTQKCFSYMGEVITNIQYHDIIRQKMEHIQTSQNELIKEINDIDGANQNQSHQINLIVKIPEITDIQVAQLLYTNKDYQTSIEKITNQLLEVGNEMKSMHFHYNSIHKNSYKFQDIFVNQVVVTQNYFTEYFENLITNRDKSTLEINNLNEEYHDLKNEYNDIFQKEKALRKEVKNFETLIEANGKNFGKELTHRLKVLFSDLQINSNSLKTHLNSITQNISSLITIINAFKPQSNFYYIDRESIDDLSTKSNAIRKNTKEYAQLSINISTEITQSLKNIKYYTFFKNTVEDIVSLLNDINQIVNYDSLKNIMGDNEEFLEKIKGLYTMKSERDVHSKLTESGKNIEELMNEKDNSAYDIDDNDIELF